MTIELTATIITDLDGPRDLTDAQLQEVNGQLNIFCVALDRLKFGYVEAAMEVDGEPWRRD